MVGRVSKWRALIKQINNVFVVYVSMFVESNNSFTKFKNPLILTIVTMLAISLRCKNKNRVSSSVLWLQHIPDCHILCEG